MGTEHSHVFKESTVEGLLCIHCKMPLSQFNSNPEHNKYCHGSHAPRPLPPLPPQSSVQSPRRSIYGGTKEKALNTAQDYPKDHEYLSNIHLRELLLSTGSSSGTIANMVKYIFDHFKDKPGFTIEQLSTWNHERRIINKVFQLNNQRTNMNIEARVES
jgi:hypothetical protein